MDTVRENETGIFFDEQSVEAVTDALRRFEQIEGRFLDRDIFTGHVRQFSKEAFQERIINIINERKRI